MLVKRWVVCSHNRSRWVDTSEIVCGWAWCDGFGALNWVERRRLGGGGGGMMLLGACVGLGLEGVRGVSLIVTGVKRISLLVGELSSELSACEVVVYISGAACTESEGATLSTFLVLSFSVVLRLLSTG